MAKRGIFQGFDGVEGEFIAKRIKTGKNVVERDWQKVHIEDLCYTLIHRSYGENRFEQTFISAFGMKESVRKQKKDGRMKCTRIFACWWCI